VVDRPLAETQMLIQNSFVRYTYVNKVT